MGELEKLLQKGRSLLQRQEQAQQEEAERIGLEQDVHFNDARAVALKLFAPLGGHLLVTPTTRPDYWRGRLDGQWFQIEPYPGAPISVKLEEYAADWTPRKEHGGYHEGKAIDLIYYVARRFRFDASAEHGVYVDDFRPVATLAEAVAWAERTVELRQKAEADYLEQRARHLQRAEERAHKFKHPSLAERLLAILDEVCDRHVGEQ